MFIEKISYGLPFLVPILYRLPLEYFIGYFFLCISKFSLKEKHNFINQLFELNSFIFLYSLYCFRNIFISYSITCLSILDFYWSGGIIIRLGIFLFSFLSNYKKTPLLFYPFIYKLLIKPSFISSKNSSRSEIIQSNVVDFLYFLFI